MTKVQGPSGRLVEAVTIDFEADAEPWATYVLADGTVMKLKVVLKNVIRLEGEFDQGGNPVYALNAETVSRVVKAKLRGEPTVMKGANPVDKRDPAVG